jgi:hypothetical protein
MTEQAFDRVAELERLAALPDEELEEKKDDAPAPEKEEEAPADKEPVDDAEDDGEDEEEEPAPEEKPADKAVSPQHARIKAKQEREQLRREVDELKRQLQEKTAPVKEQEPEKKEREVNLSVLDNLDENTRAALHEITNVYADDLARLQESIAPVIASKRTQEIMQRIDVDGEAYSKQHSLPADWLINYTMSVYHASNEEQQLLTGKSLDKKAFLDSMVNDVDRLYKAGVNPLAVYHARAKNLNPAFLQQREQVVEQPKLADTAASRAKSSGMVGTGTSPMTSSETKEAKLASDFQNKRITREDYFAGIAALA